MKIKNTHIGFTEVVSTSVKVTKPGDAGWLVISLVSLMVHGDRLADVYKAIVYLMVPYKVPVMLILPDQACDTDDM